MTENIIKFVDVHKTFKTKSNTVTALKNINIEIHKGEIFGVIGYSGAGKSTLVRLINGLESVSSGQVIVSGTVVSELKESELASVRAGIGMIFQSFNLLQSRTVFDNVAFPLVVAKWDKPRREERVWELLEYVGLTQRAYNYPEQLSGGQKQRVGIARALASSPEILLADEATSALDPETTAEVLELLKQVNRDLGVTVVLITHEMEAVRQIADRVAVLDQGELVELASAFEIFAHPQQATTKRFLKTVSSDRPDQAALAQIQQLAEGRVFIAQVSEGNNLGDFLSESASTGLRFKLHFGGISILQGREYGSLTFELIGPDPLIDSAITKLRQISQVEEVKSGGGN